MLFKGRLVSMCQFHITIAHSGAPAGGDLLLGKDSTCSLDGG